jgi:stress response protein SCP2
MNARLELSRSERAPSSSKLKASKWFIQVLQTAFAPVEIGVTPPFPASADLHWNQSFLIHGLRGSQFKFILREFSEAGDHNLLGKQTVALKINDKLCVSIPLFSCGSEVLLFVKLSSIANASPVVHPDRSPIIQSGSVIYANLAFSAPIDHPHPFDLSAVVLSSSGMSVCFSFEPNECAGICHSATTFCYDNAGPSIRLDLRALFSGEGPVSMVFFVISSNSPAFSLSLCRWIAVDIYVSGESFCHRFGNTIRLTERFQIPYFKSRISPVPSFGATATVACVMTKGLSEVHIQPVFWNAPSQLCRFTPYSAVEVLPELAAFAGLFIKVPRRVTWTPASFCSLKRALSLQNCREWIPLTVSVSSGSANDVTISCLLFDQKWTWLESVSLNHLEGGKGAVCHSGDQEGPVHETIRIDFERLPTRVYGLVICLNTNQGTALRSVKGALVRLTAARGTEVFRMKICHKSEMTGLMALAFLRQPEPDWNIHPIRSFCSARNATEIKSVVSDYFSTPM